MSLLGFFNLNFDIKDPVVFSGLQSASKWLIYCSEQVFITLSSFPASLHALVFFFFPLQLDAFGSFHCVLSAAGSNLSSSADSKIMRCSVQDDNFPSLILIHLRRHQGISVVFSTR